ncbi:MAG: general stress protein [Thermoflexibacter sp.]|jgi:hypothetical protein|nr:general stress protein [Thermoflexibacter sp.]
METLNSTVGVYTSHKKAVAAVRQLQEEGFPVEKISLLGSAKVEDDHLHIIDNETVFDTVTATGSVLGTIIGALAGMSLIAVPGVGLLYAAGALVGAVGGFSLGSLGGGIAGALLTLGIGKDGILTYKEHLKSGKYLVVVHGSEADSIKAHQILDATEHHEVNKH